MGKELIKEGCIPTRSEETTGSAGKTNGLTTRRENGGDSGRRELGKRVGFKQRSRISGIKAERRNDKNPDLIKGGAGPRFRPRLSEVKRQGSWKSTSAKTKRAEKGSNEKEEKKQHEEDA